ncbi:MAG TPA: molybdopterin-synthase adenylyltransferase MoeB [Thermoleophilaceae bacterium]|jgi:molybdopterin/thiamine biosynthesis adenylyltransferase/rhodanese-related sulfurtransferase
MPSGSELIRQVKEQIREVDPREVHDAIASSNGNGTAPLLIDVREQHEFEEAHLPGAVHVPRGHLESRIEGKASDKSRSIVLYCASGQRSALAAHTLEKLLGYQDVASMNGGITLWKDRGYEVETPRSLTDEQKTRYSRHVLLPEIGLEGQLKLLDAKVLLLGAGGLGAPTALYLAAAGVGTLGIVDDDEVDLSNLQRQVIHTNDRIGVPKVDSAEQTIGALNPDVNVVKYPVRLDASNIMEIVEGYDVIVDGVDNFPTRYLLNDATVRLKIPVVSASILGFDGQLAVFSPYEGPCYRCLYPTPPPAELAPSCGANGVLGVLPGTMGMLQATEVVKLITGAGEPLIGRLLLYEALGASFTELKVRRDPDCPICSRDPDSISDEEMGVFPDYEAFCAG